LSNIKILKKRTLASRWRNLDYPADYMPFYVYGTQKEQHIEHMLVRAPNAQITADQVTLQLDQQLTEEQLGRGVIAHINRPEKALQPPSDENKPENMFKPGASFSVTIFEDNHAIDAHGPGLDVGGTQLAKGTLVLGKSIYTDYEALNTQDFMPDPRVTDSCSRELSQAAKEEWLALVSDAMHFGS
jgi:hypothetical protein